MTGSVTYSLNARHFAPPTPVVPLTHGNVGKRADSSEYYPAGLAIAIGLAAQLQSQSYGARSIVTSLSAGDADSGTIGRFIDIMLSMRKLSVESANSTTTASDQLEIQQKLAQLSQGLNQITGQIQSNVSSHLDGRFSSIVLPGSNPSNAQATKLEETLDALYAKVQPKSASNTLSLYYSERAAEHNVVHGTTRLSLQV